MHLCANVLLLLASGASAAALGSGACARTKGARRGLTAAGGEPHSGAGAWRADRRGKEAGD